MEEKKKPFSLRKRVSLFINDELDRKAILGKNTG
jgi:hypothetical protein